MKLGFFTMPIHPLGKPYAQSLKEDRELTLVAERLGFVEGFFGEHATDAAETITSSLIFIAWLLNETSTIKLGTGTLNLPNRHPAVVAAETAMVDHMSEGRLLMGISPGGLLSDAEVFGNLDKDRPSMYREAIDQILAIWAGEAPYNLKGQHWTISTERTLIPELGQGIIAKPYQLPHPPIVVTAVSPHSQSVAEAAARGWSPISGNFLLPMWVKSHWPKFVEGCIKGGHAVDPANWRVAKSIFVADDYETAKRYATEANGPYHSYFKSITTKMIKNGRAGLFKSDPSAPDSSVTAEGAVRDCVIWGTPDMVAEQLLAFEAEVGEFGTLLYAGHDWADRGLAIRSMELMAEKVMPAVNKAARPARATA